MNILHCQSLDSQFCEAFHMTSEDPSRTELLSFHDGNQLNNDLFYCFFLFVCSTLLNSVQLLPSLEITSQINNQFISLCCTLYYSVGR